MKYNSDIHHRNSIRLKGYDYSQSGAYFITICAKDRECLFGEMVDGKMALNSAGQIVYDEWLRTGEIRSNAALDVCVAMPNHFHGIIVISNPAVGATHRIAHDVMVAHDVAQDVMPDKTISKRATHRVAPTKPCGPVSGSISAIIGQFKSIATKKINQLRNTPGVAVWQRNYHEHIIRNEEERHRNMCHTEHVPNGTGMNRYPSIHHKQSVAMGK